MTTGNGYGDIDRHHEEIEKTRAEFGETVGALAAKGDVKARGREKVAETRERARLRSVHAADAVRQKAVQAPRSLVQRTTETVRSTGQKALQVPKKVTGAGTRASEAFRQRVAKSATAAPSGERGVSMMRTFVRRAGSAARQNPAGLVVAVATAVVAGLALGQRYRAMARRRARAARWRGAWTRR